MNEAVVAYIVLAVGLVARPCPARARPMPVLRAGWLAVPAWLRAGRPAEA